jgi:hypothetical protein
MSHWEILIFFFIISFIYASVGFGGGSSYLAILAMYAIPFKEMRLIALICNIIVVTGGTIVFISNRQVNWKRILPLSLASVPMAFLGAVLKISQDTFFILLGICLLMAGVLLWIRSASGQIKVVQRKHHYLKDILLGGSIGFLSGMVGIGGGIFLSPLLNLMHWDQPKKIASTASVFILVNSIAGIAGQLTHLPPQLNGWEIVLLALAVLIGGQAGSRMGAIRFNPLTIRRITAVLVFAAGIEVLLKHLPFLK